jgi:anti-sigma B factor antagonist
VSTQKTAKGKQGSKCRLVANTDMTIYAATENLDELIKSYTEFNELEMDLSSVEEVDCSGVQLLLALTHSAELQGKQFSLSNASAAMLEVMNLLNIKDQFTWTVNN